MGSNADVCNEGRDYVKSRLAEKGWDIESVELGRIQLYRAKRGGTEHVIQVRSLSNMDPVAFPQGLDILDRIDYLVICNNLENQPNLIVMEPETIKKVIHKDSTNENAYWLQSKNYKNAGIGFEQIFG